MSYIRCRGFKFIHKLIVQIAFKNSDYQNKEWSLALSLYLEDWNYDKILRNLSRETEKQDREECIQGVQ